MAPVNESDAYHQDNIIHKSNGTLCNSKVTVVIFSNDIFTSILTKVSAVKIIRLAFAARSVTSRFTATTFYKLEQSLSWRQCCHNRNNNVTFSFPTMIFWWRYSRNSFSCSFPYNALILRSFYTLMKSSSGWRQLIGFSLFPAKHPPP